MLHSKMKQFSIHYFNVHNPLQQLLIFTVTTRGRGENDAIVYRSGAKVTIASFLSRPQGFLNRGETRSSCLTVLEPTTPTDGVAWRVVDKLNLRLQE